ncbi:hypothetical protein [Mycoplasma sp. 1654_15]|uniref:hypothetical protein n=1 Tax=Mycoplasma sp. 1654_15 TaxID=2725994 RepID=UPI001449E166|nr:hypothetical protein [Mycoplasma sp. 1654_15]
MLCFNPKINGNRINNTLFFTVEIYLSEKNIWYIKEKKVIRPNPGRRINDINKPFQPSPCGIKPIEMKKKTNKWIIKNHLKNEINKKVINLNLFGCNLPPVIILLPIYYQTNKLKNCFFKVLQ